MQDVPVTCIALDHINIRTANLATMTDFYCEVVGLERGTRPAFDFGGAWLYCGDQAVVHLVAMDRPPMTREPRLEHFALRARGLARFLERLQVRGVPYRIGLLPGSEIRQVNILDPDGNHLHIDFPADEIADLNDWP